MWGRSPAGAGVCDVFWFGVVSALFIYPKAARREVEAHLNFRVIELT